MYSTVYCSTGNEVLVQYEYKTDFLTKTIPVSVHKQGENYPHLTLYILLYLILVEHLHMLSVLPNCPR